MSLAPSTVTTFAILFFNIFTNTVLVPSFEMALRLQISHYLIFSNPHFGIAANGSTGLTQPRATAHQPFTQIFAKGFPKPLNLKPKLSLRLRLILFSYFRLQLPHQRFLHICKPFLNILVSKCSFFIFYGKT